MNLLESKSGYLLQEADVLSLPLSTWTLSGTGPIEKWPYLLRLDGQFKGERAAETRVELANLVSEGFLHARVLNIDKGNLTVTLLGAGYDATLVVSA